MSKETDENKAIIQLFLDAWNSRRPDAFDDLVAPNVVRHCEATPDVQIRSLDHVKDFLRQDTTIFPDSVQTIRLMVAEKNLVAAWATYEGTQQGPIGPFPPSGRKAQFDFGAVFRIEAGKIAEWWVTWDNMTILKALGHLSDGPNTASAARAGAAVPSVQAPGPDVAANLAAFSGRWVGIWDNNPLATTSLTIESVSPAGDVAGSYVYTSVSPARFVAKIIDDTIAFGSLYKFTFRLQPDGTMKGTRNDSGLLNTTVLTRG